MPYYEMMPAGLPAGLQTGMDAVLNKKFGTATSYAPGTWPDTVNLLGQLEEKTAVAASICTFEDGADDVPTSSVKVTIPANLDGVSVLHEAQTGRNIADVSTATKASEQRCSYVYENGGITITATGTYARVGFAIPCVKGATYTLSYKGSSDAQYKRVLLYPSGLWSTSSYSQTLTETETAYSTTFTAQSNYIYLGFYLTTTGTTGTETIKDIQIEVGSTAHAYEPYTTPTVYTANLGRTIYGGEADIVNGVGKDTHAKMTFSGAADENWTWSDSGSSYRVYAQLTNAEPGTNTFASNLITPAPLAVGYPNIGEGWINNNGRIVIGVDSSITSADDWKTYLSNNNMEIAYELADEYKTDFTFTGQEINSRAGYNAFWSDEGDTEVTYRSSGTLMPFVPSLITKSIATNGTYNASADGANGYSSVTVNVPQAAPTVTPIMSANAFVTKSGVSGTNVSQVIRSITADAAGKLVFASGSYGVTNTGSNDGYFDIQLNGTSLVKQYCNTSTNTPITIPNTDVAQNDVLDIIVGFDNAHSSCNFQLYTAVVLVS